MGSKERFEARGVLRGEVRAGAKPDGLLPVGRGSPESLNGKKKGSRENERRRDSGRGGLRQNELEIKKRTRK